MVVRVGKLYVAIPLQKYVARMSVQTHSQLIAVRVANSIQLSNLIIHAKSSQKEVAWLGKQTPNHQGLRLL